MYIYNIYIIYIIYILYYLLSHYPLSQGKVKVGCWLFGGSVVKSQLHPKVLKLKSSDIIWTGVVHTKFQLIWPRNEEVQMGAPTEPHHYFREK